MLVVISAHSILFIALLVFTSIGILKVSVLVGAGHDTVALVYGLSHL